MWLDPILWYFLAAAAGVAAFPLAYHFFPALADRGYAFSRVLGLLFWGYFFWLLSSFGVLVNTTGGILVALLLVIGLSYWAWRCINHDEFWQWLKEKLKTLLMVEALFAVSFIFMMLMRAMDPAVLGTEKPMELAFINAVLRSPSMPPLDPWLSGYAISYYYFGYVLVGMLAKLAGTSAGVAFNMGSVLVFALSAVGAYGLVYNLLTSADLNLSKGRLRALPLLGPVFVLILSNVEGFLEFIHGRGAFWTQAADGTWTSSFWSWIDLKDLINPPPGNTAPGTLRHWWWWRASRVVADLDLAGNFREVIDEFPFFSFYLADLHPHVLVIPFVMLALAICLNMFLGGGEAGGRRIRVAGMEFLFSWETFMLGVVVFGGLGFLNTWDFPWYVGIFAVAHMIRKADQDGWNWERLGEFFVIGLSFGLAGGLAYLPFYISFSSQAGGIVPNVINPTRGAHQWIMFGTLFLPLFAYLLYLTRRRRSSEAAGSGILAAIAVVVGLLVFSLAFTLLLGMESFPILKDANGNIFLNFYGAGSAAELIRVGLARRVSTWSSALTLTALFGLAVGLLWPASSRPDEDASPKLSSQDRFAVVLLIFGVLLVLIPEFFYLRDQFGTRMNTIFKFYYQAWILWALAGAYGSGVLLSSPRKLAGKVYPVVLVVVLVVGLTYPLMAVDTRVRSFQSQLEPALTLDGTDNGFYLNDDEHAAVAWLQQAPLGTLAEAVHPTGGSYTHYARISMNSGQPAVLGWIGHERQWRGGGEEIGSRQGDLERLYTTTSWEETSQIIDQYGITYIVVGNLERTTYNLHENKFIRNLVPIFEQGSVIIYHTGIQP